MILVAEIDIFEAMVNKTVTIYILQFNNKTTSVVQR